jgi:hypothetical protein
MAHEPERYHPLRWVLLLCILGGALTLGGCPGRTPDPSAPGVVPETPAPEMVSCTNEDWGYQVEYPAGWHTNSEGPLPACTLFHPTPIQVPEASEVPLDIAVMFGFQPESLDSLLDPARVGDRVLRQEETTVGGRRAVIREIEGTGELVLGRGERAYHYFIDLGDDETLIASTQEVGPIAYTEKQAVLDRMMQSLRLLDDPDETEDDPEDEPEEDAEDEPDAAPNGS